jgi:serpin B
MSARADTGQLAAADAAFGTDLYTQLAGKGNLVFSPASIAAALRMALIGARGETAAEMARAMHLPGPEAARAAQRQVMSTPGSDELILRVVNTAWIQSGLPVLDDYLDQPVEVERADFAREWEAARLAINAAVEDQTAGKITDLIAAGLLDDETRLVLVNAVYLKARWVNQFREENTRKEPFRLEGSEPVPVDMMHLTESLRYHQGDGFQAVLLPYRGGTLAMAIVLPDGPLSQFRLGPGGVSGVLSGLLAGREVYDVDLRLPKFTTRTTASLNDTLQALGIGLAFSDKADFSGITQQERLKISEVVHQANIEVDEKGTEAAAATAVIMARAAAFVRRPHVEFTADRPFLYAVVDTSTGLPLFLGQFTGPA